MTGRSFLVVLLPLALGASAAEAETYKWVDENGVTTYSNKPPPSAGKAAKPVQKVEERISVYESDPTLKIAAASNAYNRPNEAAEAEWLQRQQLMAMQWYGYGSGDGYGSGYYGGAPAYGFGGSPGVGWSGLGPPLFGHRFGRLLNPPSPAALLQPRIPPALLLQARIPGGVPLVNVRPFPRVHHRGAIVRRGR